MAKTKDGRQMRRLALEITMYKAKCQNATQLAKLFNRYTKERGIEMTTSPSQMSHYLSADLNISTDRLAILCKVLNVSESDALRLDDIYTAPKIRYIGADWVSKRERLKIRDIDDNKH